MAGAIRGYAQRAKKRRMDLECETQKRRRECYCVAVGVV